MLSKSTAPLPTEDTDNNDATTESLASIPYHIDVEGQSKLDNSTDDKVRSLTSDKFKSVFDTWEGTLCGIFFAHERFPDGILYSSKETQYSVSKAGTLLLPLVAGAIDIVLSAFYLGAASFAGLEIFLVVNDVE
eukprot:823819-Ditylum_brightwellii.AAC.1